MQITRHAEYALPADLEADIADLLAASFTTDFGGRSYFMQRHTLRFVAQEDGRLLGHMGLLYRAIRIGDATVPIWGLADVATAPEARGKGVASQLLRSCINFAISTPARFFLLFGNRPIYAGHGFVSVSNPLTAINLDGARTGGTKTTATHDLMVLPLTDEHWDSAAKIDLLGHKF